MRSGVVAAILIIVIIVAVVYTVTRGGGGDVSVPDEIRNKPRLAFDLEAKKVVEFTTWEWEKKMKDDPEAVGYKIKGGKRYAPVITCASCGKQTAAAPIPPDVDPEKESEILRNYKCPLCGKPAYKVEAL